jgi:hypothetical protein
MLRRLVISGAFAAALLGGSLVATSGDAAAQSEWRRVPTESGPVDEVVIGSLGSAFYVAAPDPARVNWLNVGTYWGLPVEVIQGARGETATVGTIGAAFRAPAIASPR